MQYSTFGRTGISVSRLILGTWYLPHTQTMDMKGLFPVDRQEASRVIRKALDLGINFFDTADVYRGVYNRREKGDLSMVGNSERVLGEALKGEERDSFVVSTKFMGRTGPGPNDAGLSRKHVRSAIEKSLERLGLDYVDIYLLHGPDEVTGPEISIRSMNDLISRGHILHFGASNHSPVQLEELYTAADRKSLEEPVAVQEIFNLVNRSFEGDMFRTVNRHGGASMIYSPLAQGLLAGRYSGAAGPVSRKEYEQNFDPGKAGVTEQQMTQFSDFAVAKSASMAQMALAWLLAKGKQIFPIVGASSVEQLEENVGACSIRLSESDMAELETIFGSKQS